MSINHKHTTYTLLKVFEQYNSDLVRWTRPVQSSNRAAEMRQVANDQARSVVLGPDVMWPCILTDAARHEGRARRRVEGWLSRSGDCGVGDFPGDFPLPFTLCEYKRRVGKGAPGCVTVRLRPRPPPTRRVRSIGECSCRLCQNSMIINLISRILLSEKIIILSNFQINIP